MNQGTAAYRRPAARVIVLLAPVIAGIVGLSGGCSIAQRQLGEACLKDGDCQSGICAQLKCTAAPPLIDAEVNGDGPLPDGESDGTLTDSEVESAAETGPEASPDVAEAGAAEAAVEAMPDVAAPNDAPDDAPPEAAGD